MRRATAIALALSFVLAGCGSTKESSSGSPSGTTTANTQRTAAGWTRHHVQDGRFSIETPSAWKTTSGLDKASLDKFLADNPQFAQYRSTLSSGVIKMFAADPNRKGGFTTNLNVLVQGLGRNVPLEEYARATTAEVSRSIGIHPSYEFVNLPAGRSARLAYEVSSFRYKGKTKKLAILQYAFVHDETAYVFSFTTLPELREHYRATFEHSARSFAFD